MPWESSSATTGDLLPSYAGVALVLFFVSIWWTVLALNAEDLEQVPITVTSAGSFARVRLAKLTVAYQGSVLLGLVGLAGPALASPSGATAAQVGAGAGAFLITALAGTAIGGICARPSYGARPGPCYRACFSEWPTCSSLTVHRLGRFLPC